jgi:hypothetical protein
MWKLQHLTTLLVPYNIDQRVGALGDMTWCNERNVFVIFFASGCPEDPAVQLIGHAVKKKWVNGRRWCEVERRTLIDINLSEWCLCRYN